MASSSARQEIGSSNQQASAYEIRGRTISLEEWELNVQLKSLWIFYLLLIMDVI